MLCAIALTSSCKREALCSRKHSATPSIARSYYWESAVLFFGLRHSLKANSSQRHTAVFVSLLLRWGLDFDRLQMLPVRTAFDAQAAQGDEVKPS